MCLLACICSVFQSLPRNKKQVHHETHTMFYILNTHFQLATFLLSVTKAERYHLENVVFSCNFCFLIYIFNNLNILFGYTVTHICLHSVLAWKLHYRWNLKNIEYFSSNNSWFLGNHCGPRQGSLASLQIPMLVLLRISRPAMLF